MFRRRTFPSKAKEKHMPCDSGYMEPTGREIDAVSTETDDLKSAIDQLVHFCDASRDTLEAAFEGKAIQVPVILDGYELIENIEKQIQKIKSEYAYKNNGGRVRQDADAMFNIADQVVAQFKRIVDVIRTWQRDEQVSDEVIAQIRKDQIQHRMGDMMRVYKFFANEGTLSDEQVTMLSNIDLRKPLTPQLGFDPDTV